MITNYRTLSDKFLLTPADLGLPPKFQSWREEQRRALNLVIESTAFATTIAVPTGGGKTGIVMGKAEYDHLTQGARSVVLTSTIALQNQYADEFPQLAVLKGRSNYQCGGLGVGRATCEDGATARCKLMRTGKCPHNVALTQFNSSPIGITNYKCWITRNQYSDGFGQVDNLFLDEGHSAPDEVCDAMSVWFSDQDLRDRLHCAPPSEPQDVNAWRIWAGDLIPDLESNVEREAERVKTVHTAQAVREYIHLRNLLGSVKTIANSHGEWIAEQHWGKGGGWKLDLVYPSDYAFQVLFLGVPKVYLCSATIMPSACEELGLTPDQYNYCEFPSTFSTLSAPFSVWPVVNIRHGWSYDDQIAWVEAIDSIIDKRLDRRGIIHVGSYDRVKLFTVHSRHQGLITTHASGSIEAQDAVRQYLASPPPQVLVSPSLHTGYDFAYDHGEYQVIGKLPFPDTKSKIAQARCGRNAVPGSKAKLRGERYYTTATANTLVQTAGRINRAKDDRGETIIIDANAKWFIPKAAPYMPRWFRDRIKWADPKGPGPKPLTKLPDNLNANTNANANANANARP